MNSEKGHPEISVIVPVYNVEKYLNACIDSILSQTYPNFELILVDDGSTDKSPQICDDYAQKDERIQVFHQTNQGQSAARNFGVSKSVGSWIHFVDSDDLIHPQMLELLYRAVSETGAKISMCGATTGTQCPDTFYEHREFDFKTWHASDDTVLSFISRKKSPYFVVWGKLIHRKIAEKYPFANGHIYEDGAVMCKWCYEAGLIAITEESLYFYFINPGGTVRSSWSKKKLDQLWAYSENMSFYKNAGWEKCLNVFHIMYIKGHAYYFSEAKKEANCRGISIRLFLKWCILVIRYHRIWREVPLDTRLQVYRCITPAVEVYWLWRAFLNKKKQKGLGGAIKSMISRLTKKRR